MRPPQQQIFCFSSRFYPYNRPISDHVLGDIIESEPAIRADFTGLMLMLTLILLQVLLNMDHIR